MSKVFQEIVIVFICIIALVIAWKIFKFLFWFAVLAVIIVIIYRAARWIINLFSK